MVDTDRVNYKRASFYEKMVEVHGIMRNYDKVIPNVEPVNIEVTLPHQWFLQGETMQIWSEELAMQIVTSLNPFVNWIGCTVTAFYLLFSVLNSLLSKRGIEWSTFTRSQGGSQWRGMMVNIVAWTV
jgi:dolichyl-phosphate-mannose--protein O-mannosyl transferase